MTDLVERLRAVNPVPVCERPAIDEVWRKLEQGDHVPDRTPRFRRARLRLRHVGLALALAVPMLVAGVAVVLLGHHQSASPARPARPEPAPAHSVPAGPASSIDAALARGVRPLAPDATLALPILGSSATRTLKSLRGKVVVLNIFASWCQPCIAQTGPLEQAQGVIAGQAATVLGVAYEDAPARLTAFVRATHISYPVLRDPTGRFARSFGVTGVPETFIIDPRGRIAAVQRFPVDDGWLTERLERLFVTQHLIPADLSLKSPPAAAELAEMATAYPVLGHRQRPADVPPHGVPDPSVLSQGGLTVNARRALVTSRGESLYIVPAHQSICVTSSDDVVQGCQPFPFTATTPADIGATICAPNLPPAELEVAGLMPPHASAITAHYSDGSAHAVTSTNGMIAIYARRAGPLPTSITWMSPHGPQHTGTGVPPDAGSSTCAS